MFAYCLNNPAFYVDVSGYVPQAVIDGIVHDKVLAHICLWQPYLSYKETCIYYNGENAANGYGFCDLYNTQTGEVWELKKNSNSKSCRTPAALAQLEAYTKGRLKHKMDLNLCMPYMTTIYPGSFIFVHDGYLYAVAYWSEGNGILRYEYDRYKIDEEKFAELLIPTLIVTVVVVVAAPYLVAGCGGTGAAAVMVAIA